MSGLSRRGFVRLTGVTAATIAAAVGTRSLLALGGPADEPPAALAGTPESEIWVKTTCALCPSGCGLNVRVVGGRAVKVEGNPLHPLNQGVCCLRGQAALEVLYSPERIGHPLVRNTPKTTGLAQTTGPTTAAGASRPWREVPWEEALDLVATRLRELRVGGQARTVAFLHGETRGSLRGLINTFMAAYGSPNVISHAPVSEGVALPAMFATQGVHSLPIYDLSNSRYVLAFGGNLLETSRHVIGYLAAVAFMRRGRPERGKLVAVSPRLGLTGIKADEWVPIRPATYGALALGMANVIISSGLYDKDFVRDYTFGFEDFEDEAGQKHQGYKSLVLQQYTLERVEMITGIPAADIARLAGEFATNRPAVALLPTEPDGLDGEGLSGALAIHALNALAGSIDSSGGVLVQRFPDLAAWPVYTPDAPALAGLAQEPVSALSTGSGTDGLPARLLSDDPYPVNVLFLLNDNPVYDRPGGAAYGQALRKIPFVVSFASVLDESAAHADVILPAGTFLEMWGDDFMEGSGYAGISLRQPVVEPVHDNRNPGDVLLQLAARLGGPPAQALPWPDYKALVDYRLTGLDMERARFLDNGFWSELVYFHAQPGSRAWADVVGRDRQNAPQDGRFDFFSRELYGPLAGPGSPADPSSGADLACLPHFELPAAGTTETATYPYTLVMQGLITQPMGWGGVVPSLQECYGLQSHQRWTSWVEIGQGIAESAGVANGDLVWIESPAGKVAARVRIYPGLWPGAVFLPPGQGHPTQIKWGRDSQANVVLGANVNVLRAGPGVTRVRIYKA